MKNNFFTRITIMLVIFFEICSSPSVQAWTGDINVNPEAGRKYNWARVSVAHDGTIYVGRVYALGNEPYRNWEVLRSTDNGLTFSLFKQGYVYDAEKFTAFDILAAGTGSDARIFVAKAVIDTVAFEADLHLSEYLPSGTISLGGGPENTEYNFFSVRGYSSVSLASDYKDPNSSASGFTLSLVAAKAHQADSIIVWTGNDANGTPLTRRGVYGTPGFIKNVSCAIGSASTNIYGRLGITWDEYGSNADEFGNIKVKYVYADDAQDVNNGGPYEFSTSNITRRPRIALSQNNDLDDIYTYVVYETDGSGNGMNVNIRADNNILGPDPATFSVGGTLGGPAGDQVNPDIVYCAATDSFYATYYDATDNQMRVAAKKDVNSLSGALPQMIANYRDASGTATEPMPRMDVLASGKLYFVWNEDDMTWFDGQSIWPASVQNVSSNLEDMNLYPNPATSNITLTFTAEEKDEATLIITDISGKTIQNTRANIIKGSNQLPVALNNLSVGNYIIRIAGSHTNTSMMFSVR